jgi:hypothetical protein
MGHPFLAPNEGTATQCQRNPTLDYVGKLPRPVPALERPPATRGMYITPIIPKRSSGLLPYGPGDTTYYYPINLMGIGNPTGVVFPAGFSYPPVIDVILYFHGFRWPVGAPGPEFTYINEYWNGHLHGIRLREDINASGKRAVLIAPTLGMFPGSKHHKDHLGIFKKPTGGDDFLDEVRRWIGRSVPEYTERCLTPTIGKLVLAGHSGAGIILITQAKGMKTPICEVWGFDSMYGYNKGDFDGLQDPITDWHDVALARSWDTKYSFHWATTGHEKELDEKYHLKNVTVQQTTFPAGEDVNISRS